MHPHVIVLFGAAGAVLTLSALVMSFARDLPHPPQLAQQSPRQYYRSLPRLLGRDRLFGKVVTIRSLSLVSLMLSPFIVLFGQERLDFAPQQVSTLVYLQIIGSLLGGWLWGQVSNRLGNQQVIFLSQSLALLLADYHIEQAINSIPVLGGRGKLLEYWAFQACYNPVSYTHLTLPTIYSV